jgi:hypothetical protein
VWKKPFKTRRPLEYIHMTLKNTKRGPSLTTDYQVMYLTTKGRVKEALKKKEAFRIHVHDL